MDARKSVEVKRELSDAQDSTSREIDGVIKLSQGQTSILRRIRPFESGSSGDRSRKVLATILQTFLRYFVSFRSAEAKRPERERT